MIREVKQRVLQLRKALPGHTCPEIDAVREWLEENDAPEEVIETLEEVRIANVQLRGVALDALRELLKWDRKDRERREREGA